VVNLVAADLLMILTDVDGLHIRPPEPRRRKPRLYDVIESITPEIERAAGGSANAFGRGGMVTKLAAAQSAARSGAATVLCNGTTRNVITQVAAGEPVGTLFASGSRLASRKHWLAFTAHPRGRLVVDEGAIHALVERGRSLLPAGIIGVEGSFGIGDPVSCVDEREREFARGLAAYASADVKRIKGVSTRRITQLLGYSNGDEVIHRDDLVLLGNDVQG
jgi:glutamate 5-kinase